MPTPTSYTLTGFPADAWSIEEWQSYVAELQARKDEIVGAHQKLRDERRVTAKDTHRYMCRLDRVLEFIARAEWEIAALEKREGSEDPSSD